MQKDFLVHLQKVYVNVLLTKLFFFHHQTIGERTTKIEITISVEKVKMFTKLVFERAGALLRSILSSVCLYRGL